MKIKELLPNHRFLYKIQLVLVIALILLLLIMIFHNERTSDYMDDLHGIVEGYGRENISVTYELYDTANRLISPEIANTGLDLQKSSLRLARHFVETQERHRAYEEYMLRVILPRFRSDKLSEYKGLVESFSIYTREVRGYAELIAEAESYAEFFYVYSEFTNVFAGAVEVLDKLIRFNSETEAVLLEAINRNVHKSLNFHRIQNIVLFLLGLLIMLIFKAGSYMRNIGQRELLRSRNELERIFNTTYDGMAVIDRDCTIKDVNDTFVTLFGGDKDDYRGSKCGEVLPGMQCDTDKCPLRFFIDKGEEIIEFEKVVEGAAGRQIPLHVTSSPMRDSSGNMTGIVESLRDLSRVKKARFNERLLSHYMQNSPLCTIICHRDEGAWLVESWNPACERLLGWSSLETSHRNILEVLDCAEFRSKFTAICSGGRAEGVFISECVTKFGDWRVFNWSVSEIAEEPSGKPYLVCVAQDITELKHTEQELRERLQERDVLLREIHHRVKNNLQVVSGILSLEAEKDTSTKNQELYTESQNRIHAMALIHEMLYKSENLSGTCFGNYLVDLANRLISSFSASDRITPEFECDTVYLTIDMSVPFGLIANELISNSLKHAFPEGKQGVIGVKLEKKEDGRIKLSIGDNGKPLPDNFRPEECESLGLQLVTGLVDQVYGELSVKSNEGWKIFTVEAELKD